MPPLTRNRIGNPRLSLRTLFAIIVLSAIVIALYLTLFPALPEEYAPDYYALDATKRNPPGSLCLYMDSNGRPVAGFAILGRNCPQVWVSNQRGEIKVPSRGAPPEILPRDGVLYLLDPSFKFRRTTVKVEDVARDWADYDRWATPMADQIKAHTWP